MEQFSQRFAQSALNDQLYDYFIEQIKNSIKIRVYDETGQDLEFTYVLTEFGPLYLGPTGNDDLLENNGVGGSIGRQKIDYYDQLDSSILQEFEYDTNNEATGGIDMAVLRSAYLNTEGKIAVTMLLFPSSGTINPETGLNYGANDVVRFPEAFKYFKGNFEPYYRNKIQYLDPSTQFAEYVSKSEQVWPEMPGWSTQYSANVGLFIPEPLTIDQIANKKMLVKLGNYWGSKYVICNVNSVGLLGDALLKNVMTGGLKERFGIDASAIQQGVDTIFPKIRAFGRGNEYVGEDRSGIRHPYIPTYGQYMADNAKFQQGVDKWFASFLSSFASFPVIVALDKCNYAKYILDLMQYIHPSNEEDLLNELENVTPDSEYGQRSSGWFGSNNPYSFSRNSLQFPFAMSPQVHKGFTSQTTGQLSSGGMQTNFAGNANGMTSDYQLRTGANWKYGSEAGQQIGHNGLQSYNEAAGPGIFDQPNQGPWNHPPTPRSRRRY